VSEHAAVRDFCASLGLGLRGAGPTLPLVLDLERSGRVHIEQEDGGDFAVYVVRTVPEHRAGVAAAALRAVHPDRGAPYRVKAAFRNEDTLILLARLPEDRLDVPTLDGLIRLLARLADEAEAAGA
jgi:type III secretion system chaperone SycN